VDNANILQHFNELWFFIGLNTDLGNRKDDNDCVAIVKKFIKALF